MLRVLVALLGLLAFLPIDTRAQGLTGTLVGTVRDMDGGVLPGAVVRVTSPALMGGERQTVSSDRGQWRLPVLPPGQYALIVELAPRFTAHQ
jgi:carboxypeptidase family protein